MLYILDNKHIVCCLAVKWLILDTDLGPLNVMTFSNIRINYAVYLAGDIIHEFQYCQRGKTILTHMIMFFLSYII